MSRVADKNCSLFNTVPAPRVLQNQLDRSLESYMASMELRLLKELQKAMLQAKANTWIAIFVAVVIILHTRERDIWRLEHWVLHPEVVSDRQCTWSFRAYNNSHINGDTQKRLLH